MKNKIFITAIIIFSFWTVNKCIKTSTTQDTKLIKTEQEIAIEKVQNEKQKSDSILELRKEKIDFALTTLKEMIKGQMKNPNSYEIIDRIYDTGDTGNIVKLLIHYRGDNSFGGKASSTVYANYNLEKDNVTITKQVKD